MLYATDGIETDEDFNKAMVGVASVWYALSFILYYYYHSSTFLWFQV